MALIPNEFIVDLLARINIVDIVGQRVKLKKRGGNYFGCCPFHNEKTASFSVSEKKQIFHCFGCGVNGSVVTFLMDYDRLTYPEAIEELASTLGLEVPRTESNHNSNQPSSSLLNKNFRQDIYKLMDNLTTFYQQCLKNNNASIAQNYLANRGLDQKAIQHYRIGFSPDEWNTTNLTVANTPALKTLYNQAGMLVTNENKNSYDRFRGRIMFPIRDRQGNIIAFGGRTIKADDSGAKYINSPETPIFFKGRNLYGLYEALEFNRNPSKLLVVEGYMDVVSLFQYGIPYAVAALGTATSEDHIKQLFRITDTIVFCYDGDEAGKRAAWKALNVLLPVIVDGKQVKFVFLPENDDPDSLVRKEGKDQFEQRLDNGLTLSQFLFDELVKQVDLKTAEGKAKLSALALPLISQINAQSFSLNLKQQLGDYLGYLDLNQIDKLMAQQGKDKSSSAQIARPSMEMKLTTMRILIGLLIQYPELAKLVPDTKPLQQIKLAGINIFIDLLNVCKGYSEITTAQILVKYVDTPLFNQLSLLANWEHRYPEDEISKIFSHTLKELYDNILSQRRDELIAKDRTDKLSITEKKELATLILVLSKKD